MKSLTKLTQDIRKKYGCGSVSVTHYEPLPHHPKGWWSVTVTSVTKPAVACVSEYGEENPKEACAKLCAKLDALLAEQELPARQAAFQAASAAWFESQRAEVAKAA